MPRHTSNQALTGRYVDALEYAFRIHGAQIRKTSPTPYIAHLLSVSALVLEHRGTEDQAIAGLLHDSVEDTDTTVEEIAKAFGPIVAQIVDDCTDPIPTADASWLVRKKAKLARVGDMQQESLVVYACDKLHNLRQMAEDMIDYGPTIWESTGGGFHLTVEYYTEYTERLTQLLEDDYRSLCIELTQALDSVREIGTSLGLAIPSSLDEFR